MASITIVQNSDMSWITRNLRQTVTHWAKSGTRDSYGQSLWSAPVTLAARWEDKTETILNQEGEEVLSRSTVYLPSDVEIGDYLLLGENTGIDPTTISGTFKVKDFRKIPQLRGDEFERVAFL